MNIHHLISKLAKALNKSGIDRELLFRGRKDIFIYYADPNNPKKIIREAADGSTCRGTVANGKFEEEQ